MSLNVHSVGRHTIDGETLDCVVLTGPVEALRAAGGLLYQDVTVAAVGERAAAAAYLRAVADAPHPVEEGAPNLSPAGRGLLLWVADRIEAGVDDAE